VFEKLLKKISSPVLNNEFRRLYHGRGEEELRFLTIDSIDKTLFVQLYENIPYEKELYTFLKEYIKTSRHDVLIIKKRHSNETFALVGEIPKNAVAVENGIKFRLNFFNQNIGYFGDMKNARKRVEQLSENKNILNLFAYTCGFSLFARRGGAKKIANVDMSRSALSTGMSNHRINGLDVKNISFWPYNILKAFAKIKKNAPYDIVIIDPPTYQKGSFNAKEDYVKLIKKLPAVCYENTLLLACVNSPSISKEDLIKTVQNIPFTLKEEIKPPPEYTNSSLKTLLFKADFKNIRI